MAGSGRAQKNKAHKTRFSSKSSRRQHKLGIANGGVKPGGKITGKNNAQTARDLRVQRNKNIRDHKRASLLEAKRANNSEKSPPKILAIFSLSSKVDVEKLKERILLACSSESVADTESNEMEIEDTVNNEIRKLTDTRAAQFTTSSIPKYKLRLTVANVPRSDLQACLEVAKVADIIAFAFPAICGEGSCIDEIGKKSLSMLRAQGMPAVMGLMLGLHEVGLKKRAEVKKEAISAFHAELPLDSKVFTADVLDECRQVLRHIADQRLSSPQWRIQRPYVLAEKLEYNADNKGFGTLMIAGYVRGHVLSVNHLVHVAGIGDFQLKQVDVMEDPYPFRQNVNTEKLDSMLVDEGSTGNIRKKSIFPDPELQEMVVVENTPDMLANEQTWPTEEELAKASEEQKCRAEKMRKLPKGTSSYQASWIVDESDEENKAEDDEDDDEEDGRMHVEEAMDDIEENSSVLSEDGGLNHDELEPSSKNGSVWDDEDDSRSDMMEDEVLTVAQKKAELKKIKEAHKADEELPDEVDTPMDMPARKRFAKYRGLKSFRTSSWDPKESLPLEYARIFAFDNYNRTLKHVLKRANAIDNSQNEKNVEIGTFIKLYIKDVPSEGASALLEKFQQLPVIGCGLLQHESKMSVLHFSVRKHESYPDPIKSKERLIFHSGFRHYITRPIFSSDDINVNKHKFERFLHPGRFSIASVFAPISFPPLPLIIFKSSGGNGPPRYVASGSLRSVDPDRIILKRVVLSGYPLRVQKRKAVVRYMFHNPDDVLWFKPLELWTKYGRRGRIKEPVGTHGAMKCIFDGTVQQRDTVCISLYKRIYPKWPENKYSS